MSSWLVTAGAQTLSGYACGDLRIFSACVQRAYEGMRRTRSCTQVLLPPRYFGVVDSPEHQVWCCKIADNTPPRLACGDRELFLRIDAPASIFKGGNPKYTPHERARKYVSDTKRPWFFGVDAAVHGGPWFSRDLIYSFLVGLEDDVIPEAKFACKAALGRPCGGVEASVFRKPLKPRKPLLERRSYNAYAQEDCQND